jgi:glycosyltransferase involved in cell wall biosynthesis
MPTDPKPPVILQVIPHLNTGGAEISTIEMAEAISQAGGRALVASQGGRLAASLSQAGGVLIPFAADTKNPVRLLHNALRLKKIIVSRGVSLVHARSRAPAWSALLAARVTRTPFVTTYHGAYNQSSRIKSFYNSVMARGDLVIANSDFTAELARARHSIPPGRVTVIHRGVDHSRFDPARVNQERAQALREAWGARPGEKIVLQAARLTRWKGQEIVIDAAALLKARGLMDGVVFVLAGDDQGRAHYSAQLRARIASHGLQEKVRIVGHCNDMPSAFSIAHVALVASVEPEAFGRTAAEAQAMGCPVIASKAGALTETVRDANDPATAGATGWLVPPGDAGAMAGSLARAISMTENERAAVAAAAVDHIARNFSKASLQLKTLSLYDALLNSELAEAFERAR